MVRQIWQFIWQLVVALVACMALVVFVIWMTYHIVPLLGGTLITNKDNKEVTVKDNKEVTVSIEAISQLASIIVGTVAIVLVTLHQSRKELVADGREVYQRLELASIDLFRFEAEQKELIRPLWEAGVSVPPSDTEQMVFQNYVCQNLNLHEMAIRFRKDKIMPDEVFDSWIAWFWTLSKAPGFSQVWNDVREDYIAELQSTYNKGIKIALREDGDDDKKHEEFREWLVQELKNGTLGKPAEDNCADSSLLRGSCHVSSASRVEPPPTPDLAWESDPAAAPELAQFFAREATPIPEYISHGEVQIGRAKDFEHWNYGLDSHSESEFQGILNGTAKPRDAGIVVARVDEKLVAIAVVRFVSVDTKYPVKSAVLEDLVVAQEFRGQGIGKAVVLWVEAEAKTQEVSFLFLESGVSNREAHDFFAQLDYRKCSFVMAKSLP